MSEASEMLYATLDAYDASVIDDYRLLPVRLHQAREGIANHMRVIFQRYNLTDQQWRVLRILSTVDEIDLKDLSKRSMLLGPSLSRIMRDLDRRQLITRWAGADDARRSLAAISTTGRELIDQVAPHLNPVFDRLRGEIDSGDASHLNALLEKVIKSFSGSKPWTPGS